MNQQTTHILKSLFLRIQPFSAGDARNRSAWRKFKTKYNQQPRSTRAKYIINLHTEIEGMLARMATENPVT